MKYSIIHENTGLIGGIVKYWTRLIIGVLFLLMEIMDIPLKVMSTTFWLVCFLSLKESTWETRKNVFYFTSKALFVPGKIKF